LYNFFTDSEIPGASWKILSQLAICDEVENAIIKKIDDGWIF